ncbi:lambda-exonuclease family protein [Photobacterium damselae]|uniref:lambda-exonuclease family protein n=1 Tax=Photobacterium damselae TaxID=38293 RepID=UPI00406785BB
MYIHNLIQDTEPWHDWRRTGIGSSDVLTIIGCNSHKTRYQLWAELSGLVEAPDLSNNPNIKRGKRYEFKARRIFEQGVKDEFEPICITNELYDPLHASLDGYSFKSKRILEIKCPSLSVFQDVVKRKRLSEAFRIYYTQVQYQMLVAEHECDYAILFFYCLETGESLAFNIEPNTEYQEWLKHEVLWFWDLVVTKKPPELDRERDTLLPEFVSDQRYKQWERGVANLVEILAEKKEIERRLKELTADQREVQRSIISLFDGFRSGELNGVKVKVSTRKGNVDYKQLLEDIEVETGVKCDIDAYRGSPTNTILVSVDKKRGEELSAQYLKQKINQLHEEQINSTHVATLI